MSTGLTGAPSPTSRYARFVWSGTTIDLDDPLWSAQHEVTPILGQNFSISGVREALSERIEHACVLTTPLLKPAMAARIERMIENWVGIGNQVEVYVDRGLRGFWGFEGETTDQNRGNPFATTIGGVTLSYATLADGLGLTFPATGVLRAALVSTLAGGTGNAFFDPLKGLLVLRLKPDWAGNDGAEHVLADCLVADAQGANRLLIKKRVDNLLHVAYYGGNSGETIAEVAVSWGANTEHTLIVEWGAALSNFRAKLDGAEFATRKYCYKYNDGGTLKYAGQNYGTVKGATPTGSEQVMASGPDRAALGIDDNGVMGRATGAVGALAIYALAYAPAIPDALGTYEIAHRTYFPRGELVDATFRPIRVSPGRELFQYQFRVRDGR